MRIKAERDFNSMKEYAFDEGMKKGVEKGRNEGIQEERKRTEKLIQVQKRKNALHTAIKLKKANMPLDTLSEIVEIPKEYLKRFFKKIRL
jgi:predicted transposase YdaD